MKMNFAKAAVALLALVAVHRAWANTATVDGIKWTYKVYNGSAHIGGGGTAVPTNTVGDIIIPSKLAGYSVSQISDGAFTGCDKLTSVTIPSSVYTIGEAFNRCNSLTSIVVSASNPNYCSLNGFMYDKEMLKLVVCPAGLTNAIIPYGVISLYSGAFSGSKLQSIVFPATLTSLGFHPFVSCTSLKSIVFEGNAPELTVYIQDLSNRVNSACSIYVKKDSVGWNVPIPGKWCGVNIKYLSEDYQPVAKSWYSVAFDCGFNGRRMGGGASVQFVTNGCLSTLPIVQAVDGYKFVGWNPDPNIPITSDVTFVACYEPETQIVTTNCKVSVVNVIPRWPWNGLVDIDYTIEAQPKDVRVNISVNGYDMDSQITIPAMTLEGYETVSSGTHRITWDVGNDYPDFHSENFLVDVKASIETGAAINKKRYMVIDLSKGKDTESYPISYLEDVPAGGWTREYKTSKLVFRRIEGSTFKMNGLFNVTITRPYYISIFEVTQKQYALVTGMTPSKYKGDDRPVEMVSWNMIRGNAREYNWPIIKIPDPNSFVGLLRFRSKMAVDLPTEAQWEYACRAGTTSAYNNGGNTTDDLMLLGRYYYNQKDGNGGYTNHTVVGSYQPNAWGIYDMHGNVEEWCLDRYGSLTQGGRDPVGPSSGRFDFRIYRGGQWQLNEEYATSSYRSNAGTDNTNQKGIRLVVEMNNDNKMNLNSSNPVCVDTRTSFGGRVANSVELVGHPDGASVVSWDTTKEPDGWKVLTANKTQEVAVCVLNQTVAVHGGRLMENEIWTSNKVHVVKGNVIIPYGKTLTIEADTIVKFAPNAKISAEFSGLRILGGRCADIADDSVGGDTNMDGDKTTIETTFEDWFSPNCRPAVKSTDGLYYSSFHDAINVAKPGTTIKLLNDLSGDWLDLSSSKELTIDLNGKKIDVMWLEIWGGDWCIVDTTGIGLVNGCITVYDGTLILRGGYYKESIADVGGNVVVAGGLFAYPVSESYIGDGKVCRQREDGLYVVEDEPGEGEESEEPKTPTFDSREENMPLCEPMWSNTDVFIGELLRFHLDEGSSLCLNGVSLEGYKAAVIDCGTLDVIRTIDVTNADSDSYIDWYVSEGEGQYWIGFIPESEVESGFISTLDSTIGAYFNVSNGSAENLYKVKFEGCLPRMGDIPLIQRVAYGVSAEAPTMAYGPVEIDGVECCFQGWDSDEWQNVTRDLTISAIYAPENVEPTTYTIIFDLGAYGTRTGGGELTQSIEEGGYATAPTVQAVSGWRFVGWSPDVSSSIWGDTTFVAQYEQDAVTYHLEIVQPERGGSITGATSGPQPIDSMLMLMRKADTGYHIVGWTGDIDGLYQWGDSLAVVMDMPRTIGLSVAPDAYSITYADTRGAANGNPATYTIEDEVVFAPLPDVTGWKFMGWSPVSIPAGSMGAVTVTAQWVPAECSVTIGGEETKVTWGSEITFRAPEPLVDELCKTQLVYVGTSFTAPVVTNEFTVVVTNDIDFTWDILATNYWLNVEDAELGVIDGAGDGWQKAESVVALTAVADAGCRHYRWLGDIGGCAADNNILYVKMDRTRTVGARFAYDVRAVIDSVSPQNPTEESYLILQGHGEGGSVAEHLWTAVRLSDGTVSELARTANCSVKLNAGEWRIEYRVKDMTGIWSEPASQTITVSALIPVVDLQVARTGVKFYDSIGLPTSNIETGDVVTVKVTVQNRGNANMSGRATLYLCDGILPVDDMSALTEDDPRVLATARVSRLNLGKSQTVSMTWNVGSSLSGEERFYDEGPNAFTVVVVSDADTETVVNNNLVTTMLELGESDIELSEIFNLSADYETSIFVGSDYSVSGRVWYERDGARVYVAGATLTFMIDGEIAGSGVADSSGRYLWMFTAPDKGSHTISVKAVDGTVVKTYAGTFTSVERAEPDADGQPGAGGGSGGEEENPEDPEEPVPSVKKANLKVQTFVCEGDGITGMNGNAYSVALGGEVTLDAVVKNVGQMAVTNAFSVKITDITNDDVLGYLVVTNGLAVGEELNVSIDEPFVLDKAGRYGYRVIVDEEGVVYESSETDNESKVWVTVEEPLPNLVVTDMTFSDSQPVAGDELVVRAKVRNIGDATCPAGVKVVFNMGNSMSEIELSDELSVDASADVAYSIIPAEGTLKISIEADHFDEIAESNEADNRISRTIAIYSVNADVKPISLGAEPYPKAGEPCVLTAVFRNDGGASYQGGKAMFFVDNPDTGKIAEVAVGPIAWKGGVGTATCVWTPDINIDRVVGVMLGEKVYKTTFSATPPPDLRVVTEDISFEPGTPSSGDKVKFRAMIRNVSGSVASTNATVVFDVAPVDGDFAHLTTMTVSHLAPGGSVAVDADIPYTVLRGIYKVKVSVMDESGRDVRSSDNIAERIFGVDVPVAVTGGDIVCVAGDTVTLDGSDSIDATQWRWSLIEAPNGNTASISDASVAVTTFTPHIAGLYKFSLVVSDGLNESTPAECTVLVDRVRITASAAKGGSISPSGEIVYPAGATPEYVGIESRGYSFDSFKLDGVSVTNKPSTYMFTALDRNHIIEACFSAVDYSITYNELKGAENTNPATYTIEDEVVFAPLSNVEGWNFVGWSPKTIAKGSTGAITVTAQWERVFHSVNVGGASTNVVYGSAMTFRAPEPWYDETCTTQIVYVGTTFTAPVVTNEFTVVVTNDIDFTWDILATNYWLKVSASEGGSVDSDSTWMSAGSRKSISATPDFSYRFVRWEGDVSDSQSTSPDIVVLMNQARSLKAVFEKIPLTIGEAANAPEYEWYTEGDAVWFGEWSKAASDGVHAVRSGAIGDSKETVLGLRLEGAGTLSFDWRASCEERYDAVRLEVDGKQIRVLWGETSWTNVCINLDVGEHDIRWVYKKGRSGALGDDAIWVDNVVWESATEPTLAEALGEFEWETEGDVNWAGMRSEYAYEGTSFAIAEGLGDFEASIIRTRVSGAGTIKFRWAVSCEEFYDWFDFVVDGEVVEMTTGETDWMEVSVELGEGDHVLEWMYWKDEMDDLDLVGANCAMLDYVRWYPLDETPPEISDKTLAAFFAWLKANNQISQNATKEDAIRVFSSGMTAVGKSATLYSEFVAGTNPADVTSEFKAMIEIDENNQPIITPSPNLGSSRKYVVFGKKNIDDSAETWKQVEKGKEKDYNFFKITVDLPE